MVKCFLIKCTLCTLFSEYLARISEENGFEYSAYDGADEEAGDDMEKKDEDYAAYLRDLRDVLRATKRKKALKSRLSDGNLENWQFWN